MQTGTVFKTPILREILRIQNLHQVEHCAFLDVIQLFQSVGCVRTNFRFAQLNRIRNHLFGLEIEIRWVACSGIVGSNCFCFRKHDSDDRENGATGYH